VVTIAKPLQSIRYEVVVTDSSGCVAKDELAILINRQEGVYVPNAFSPNGDGVNDVLTVFTDPSVRKITYFRIFDRWGNLVYEGQDLAPGDTQQGWDGTFAGEKVPNGGGRNDRRNYNSVARRSALIKIT
jgi:gliding motility-associated-like protein